MSWRSVCFPVSEFDALLSRINGFVPRGLSRPPRDPKAMHALDLAGLASTLASSSAALLADDGTPTRQGIQQYWLNSRFRHESWSRRLAAHRDSVRDCTFHMRRRCWHEVLPIMLEVLFSEPLTRGVAYQAHLLEQHRLERNTKSAEAASEFSVLAHSALSAHIEARNRCLHLIVFGQGLPVEDAVRLNRVRRTMESYTDQILAVLPASEQIDEYAFEGEAVGRIQIELRQTRTNRRLILLHLNIVTAGLRRNLQADVDWRVPSAVANAEIAQAVLSLLRPAAFDCFGVPKTAYRFLLEAESPESTGHANDLCRSLEYPLSLIHAPREIETSPSKPRW